MYEVNASFRQPWDGTPSRNLSSYRRLGGAVQVCKGLGRNGDAGSRDVDIAAVGEAYQPRQLTLQGASRLVQ